MQKYIKIQWMAENNSSEIDGRSCGIATFSSVAGNGPGPQQPQELVPVDVTYEVLGGRAWPPASLIARFSGQAEC